MNSQVLVSTKTIYESGITANSTITVDIKNINIKVKITEGQTEKIEVDPDNLLKTVKDKLKDEHDIDPAKYNLKLGGTVLNDTKTIYQ